jgi:hypothetical protein
MPQSKHYMTAYSRYTVQNTSSPENTRTAGNGEVTVEIHTRKRFSTLNSTQLQFRLHRILPIFMANSQNSITGPPLSGLVRVPHLTAQNDGNPVAGGSKNIAASREYGPTFYKFDTWEWSCASTSYCVNLGRPVLSVIKSFQEANERDTLLKITSPC